MSFHFCSPDARTIHLLFRKDGSDPTKYQALWPDRTSMGPGLSECFPTSKHFQRILGLPRILQGFAEKLVELRFFPLDSRDDDLHRIPGYRVRRFYLSRTGQVGRIHFMDGTPTDASYEIGHVDERFLLWLGLRDLADGQIQWFDLAATDLPPESGAVSFEKGELTELRLVLHALVEDDNSPQQIRERIVELYRAINDYCIVRWGRGLTIDEFNQYVLAGIKVGA